VGGKCVALEVGVEVRGKNGVQDGASVRVRVAVFVWVSVGEIVDVVVSILGVDDNVAVRVGVMDKVAVVARVPVTVKVIVGGNVGVGFSGINVQASHPTQ
jgi:hypothetical protein